MRKVLFFSAVLIFTSSCEASELTEIRAILTKIVEGRQKIKSGHFLLDAKWRGRDYGDNGIETQTQNYSMDIFVQNEKIRMEKTRGRDHYFVLKNAFTPSSFVLFSPSPYSVLPLPSGVMQRPVIALYEGDYDYADNSTTSDGHPIVFFTPSRDFFPPDVRVLGIVEAAAEPGMNIDYLNSSRFRIIDGFRLSDLSLADVELGASLCKRLTWTTTRDEDRPTIVRYSCWVDPRKEYIVRRYETVCEASFGRLHNSMENEVTQHAASGIWYPSRWTFEMKRDEKVEVFEECTLEVKSMNEPIPDEIFTIATLPGLEKGTVVAWFLNDASPGKIPLVWDGKEIVGEGVMSFKDVMEEVGSKTQQRRRYFIIAVNATVISGILALLFYRAWLRKRKEI